MILPIVIFRGAGGRHVASAVVATMLCSGLAGAGAASEPSPPAIFLDTSCALAISVAMTDHVAGDAAVYADRMKAGWGQTGCIERDGVYLVRFPTIKQPTSGGHVEYRLSGKDFSVISKQAIR